MPKFIVTERYSGTREVEVEADTGEDAINKVRIGEGNEVHRWDEPTEDYDVEESPKADFEGVCPNPGSPEA